jgi:hypothetical protein
LAISLFLAMRPVTVHAGDFDLLLKPIPDGANAIVVIDVAKVFDSGLAKMEDWRKRYADVFEATPLVLPPNAEKFMLASEMDIEFMQPAWEVASAILSTDPSVQEIADLTGGVVDSFFGLSAVWTGSQMCAARFEPHLFGLMFPATRQSAARWIRRTQQAGATELSPYLMEAIGYVEDGQREIVMAFDLEHIVRPDEIRAMVDRSRVVSGLDKDAVTRLFATLRGVTLGVGVDTKMHGQLSIDFAGDTAVVKNVAKPLMLAMLTAAGAVLDEMHDWAAAADGKHLVLEGDLSEEGMRRLFSLVGLNAAIIDRPGRDARASDAVPQAQSADPFAQRRQEEDQPPTSKSPVKTPGDARASGQVATGDAKRAMAVATARYFQTVQRYTNDLRQRRPETIADVALWIDSYARKIGRLPVRNVDPDMIAYAQTVAGLMENAVAVGQTALPQALQKASEWTPKGTLTLGSGGWGGIPTVLGIDRSMAGYYGFGGYNWRYRMPMANVDIESIMHGPNYIANEDYQRSMEDVQKILDQIQYETDQVRQLMTDRYGRDFRF